MSANKRKHPMIPQDADLVFDGIRSQIYQWNQTMYDGSTARFERIRFLDGAFTIPILPNNNILLTYQEQPGRTEYISLPGGAIDADDLLPIDGARRELLEETGYQSDEWYPWFEFDGSVHSATYVYYFIARSCYSVAPIAPDPGEKISLFEVDFDGFLALASDPRFIHRTTDLLPIMYEARLHREKYDELHRIFYGE